MSNVNELLTIEQYQHLNDVFNSTNTDVYLNDYYLSDCVSISYDIIYDKLPIYSWNSEFYTKVAAGNVIVQGTFGVIFTETAYFEVLRQHLFESITKEDQIDSSLNMLEDGTIDDNNIYGAPIKSYITRTPSVSSNELLSNSIYNGTLREVSTNKNGEKKESPYVRHKTLYDYMGTIGPLGATFENYAEKLEDFIWGSPNSQPFSNVTETNVNNGIATWDPTYRRIRNDMELDYTYTKESDSYVRGIMSGTDNPLTLYIIYGDSNVPSSDHTTECINDIHITGRQLVVNNDGAPVIALYRFFGRMINGNMVHALREYNKGNKNQV